MRGGREREKEREQENDRASKINKESKTERTIWEEIEARVQREKGRK